MGLVAAAEIGERNERLNVAAFCLGQLVAGGEASDELVAGVLLRAGVAAGLPHEEVMRTIRSGMASPLPPALTRTRGPRWHLEGSVGG